MTTVPRSIASEIVLPVSVAWEERAPGIHVKSLWRHPENGRRVMLARFDPGTSAAHRHVGHELTFVLEGVVADDWNAMTPGDLAYHPPGCAHTEHSTNGVLYLALVDGPTERGGEPGTGQCSEVYRPHEVAWLDARSGMLIKRLWAHASGSPRVGFMRFEPGATFGLHRHDGEEIIFVLEGSVHDEAGEAGAGAIAWRPDGCTHSVSSRNGATLLVFAWGGVEMIEPAAGP